MTGFYRLFPLKYAIFEDYIVFVMNFSKKMLLIVAFMLANGVCHAQNVIFGVKGGLSAAWLTNTVLKGDETVFPHNGLYAGGTATFDLTDNIILQTELLFATKGHSDKDLQEVHYSRTLGYLQLPLLAGYRFNRKDYTVMVGPELGYLLFSRTKVGEKKLDSTSECSPFNLALALQTAYMVNYNFGIEMKFEWGMTHTFKPGMYGEKVDDKGRNVALQIGVCYRFD